MSWEGFQQNLCVNGHEYTTAGDDEWDFTEENGVFATSKPICPHCQGECVWWNLVDTTNGSFTDDEDKETQERIDGYVELEVLQAAVVCTCQGCGNEHLSSQPRYHLPPPGIGHRV